MANAQTIPMTDKERLFDPKKMERGLWQNAWLRLRQNHLALVGAGLVALLILVALLAPLLAPHDPNRIFDDGITDEGMPLGPTHKFLLGTDRIGRDLLSRLIYGARITVIVGVLANGLGLAIGVVVGMMSAYFGRGIDMTMMRITDVVMGVPGLLLVLGLASVLKPSMWNVILVIGLIRWAGIARVMRGEVLSIKEEDFILAAQSVGSPSGRILIRHVLPQLVSVIIVYGTLGIATTVLFEASLSYLGFGVPPPTATWGGMVSEGQGFYRTAPWLMMFPGLAVMMTVLGFNLLGDGLRDALDPRQWR